jgi:hemoglobin-like flavoprotein
MIPGTAPILTSRQKQLVRQSFESIEDYSNSVIKLFYGRLFELQPALRALFKNSIEDQSRKLLDMLRVVVEALDRFEDLRPMLAELGRKHITYGVKLEHYEVVRIALLWAFAQALDLEFDRETKAAWDQMLRAISAAMIEGCASSAA